MNLKLSTTNNLQLIATMFPAILILFPASLFAQSAFYTFTSGPGGDGFIWDGDSPPSGLNDLQSGDTFFAPTNNNTGEINIENFSENTTFFDTNYQAAGNSSLISDEAWWGNPIDDGFAAVGASFINTNLGGADSVSFDFAWAFAGAEADQFIDIEVYDDEFNEFAFLSFSLDNPFNAGPAFGNFDGWEGSISFNLEDVQFDNPNITKIENFSIDLTSIATLGGTSEFAIDNLSINGAGTNSGSNVFPSFNSGQNANGVTFGHSILRNTGPIEISQEVSNDGALDTTFSSEIVAGGDLTDGGQVSGEDIFADDTYFISPIATFDSNTLSGAYESDFRFLNDLNSNDPDDQLTHRVRVHDPAQLTDNTVNPVQVESNNELFISNAAAGPHAGAIRAGAKVSNRQITGPFQFIPTQGDLENDAVVDAGETKTAQIVFDRYGRLNGTYNGTASVDLLMVSTLGFFLQNAQGIPGRTWNLEYELATIANDSIAVAAAESLGPNKIGVNNTVTAATILDGNSSSSQTMSMAFVSEPEQGDPVQSADTATNTVDVDFSVDADLYVLQFTYDDSNVPNGSTEEQMQLLVFDSLVDDWMLAIDDNSDGGAGSSFFSGSYADFLVGAGGGSLDASDLSAFGVDVTNNMAWAVLDHASLFSLGVLGTFTSADVDLDNDGDVDGADFLLIQRNDTSLIPQWQSEYPNPLAAAQAQAVPEPAGIALATFSLALFLRRQRQS